MSYSGEQRESAYRNCKWCNGRGCISCDQQEEAAYKAAFPNGLQPMATFKTDDPADMERAKKCIGVDALRKAFGPGGGGVTEIQANIDANPPATSAGVALACAAAEVAAFDEQQAKDAAVVKRWDEAAALKAQAAQHKQAKPSAPKDRKRKVRTVVTSGPKPPADEKPRCIVCGGPTEYGQADCDGCAVGGPPSK